MVHIESVSKTFGPEPLVQKAPVSARRRVTHFGSQARVQQQPKTTPAVDQVSLTITTGEILALGGASGSGKTTLLRIIAGFERPDDGRVSVDGRTVVGPGSFIPPERRGVGMVFQDRSLFPHLSVLENVAFGLTGPRRNRRRRALRLLELTGIADHRNKVPHELSGGQQQRVALARALAPGPSLVLLDEPFSNLDGTCTHRLLRETRAILRSAGATAIIVTHSRYEAFSVADRIAILHNGRLQQVDSPPDIYRRPATRTVAEFGGGANFIPVLHERGTRTVLGELNDRFPIVDDPEGGGPVVVIRPSELQIELPAPSASAVSNRPPSSRQPGAPGRVLSTRFLGDRQETIVRLTGTGIELTVHGEPGAWSEGAGVMVREVYGSLLTAIP